MSVALGRVQKKVTNTCTRNVLGFWSNVCEDNPLSNLVIDPARRQLSEIIFPKIGKPEQPEYGLGNTREDAEPRPKRCRLNLSRWSTRVQGVGRA